MLLDLLEHAAVAVDSADAAPSPDAETGLRELEPAEAAALTTWEALAARSRTALAGGKR